MSSIERRLAEGIAANLSDAQIESTESNPENPRPGFRLKVSALKRHLGSDVTDEQYAFQQIAIKSLVQSILNDSYREGLVSQRINSLVRAIDAVGVLPEKDPARPLIFEEPTRILADSVPIEPPEFKSARREIK